MATHQSVPVGTKLDEVTFLDDEEEEFYTFEFWRRMMESNRPVLGLCATNRDWTLPLDGWW